MLDLYIMLKYMSASDIKRIGHDLRSNPSDTEPGWYLCASRNEGYDSVLKYTRLTPEATELIAAVMDTAVNAGWSDATPRVARAVSAINTEHARQRIERRKRAEKALMDAQRTLAALDAEEGSA